MNRIHLLRNAIIADKQRDIPSRYRRVPFIASDGKPYIDLDYIPSPLGKTVVQTKPYNTLSTVGLWGYIHTYNVNYRNSIGITSGKWFAGEGVTNFGSNYSMVDTLITYDRKNSKLYCNQDEFDITSVIVSTAYRRSAFLFARNDGTSAALPYGTSYSGEVSKFQEYNDDGDLIISMESVLDTHTNELGMYDTVRKRFFGNLGNGQFTQGEDIEEEFVDLEYIESDGDQWIDTKLPNTGDYIIEDRVSINLLLTPTGDGGWIIGGRLKQNDGLCLFASFRGVYNAYGGTTNQQGPVLEENVWYDIYFDKTTLTIGPYSYIVQGQKLVAKENETNILLGKNQVIWAGNANDPRNFYGKRASTKIRDAVSNDSILDLVASRGVTTGRVGMRDKLTNKLIVSSGPRPFIAGPDLI